MISYASEQHEVMCTYTQMCLTEYMIDNPKHSAGGIQI